ncbi:MOSC domain-containing protein [Psychromonas ossibalaenae]|uniref:MOSC domain-containing protein n=1 Tax=Psychromonas ossibalaenae TaxID=444922 RepID=UPI00036184CF|nr:MOSC domain-containing protein [Psychromonas ossibalaenae]
MFPQKINTAIDKHQVTQINVTLSGISGDEHVYEECIDEDRVILQCAPEHYSSLKARFPDSSHLFVNGGFGENLTAEGMNEHNMCIGDILQIGEVKLELCLPRQPCFKLNHRFEQPSISRHVQDNAQTGWFYRALSEGIINQGDNIELLERPNPEWTIAKVQHYLYVETDNKLLTKKLAELEPLADEVKDVFKHRLASNSAEDWNDGEAALLEVRVVKIIDESDKVKRLLLSRTDLSPLPAFTAGAHISLHLGNGLTRAYSLCASLNNDCYEVAVGLAPDSRGGSKYIHEQLKLRDVLQISEPANLFTMTRAKKQVFAAAGIGITPFLVMIEEAAANNEQFELHYCVDDTKNYPFQSQLAQYQDNVFTYSLDQPLDINALLDNHQRGTHVYTCGSPGFTRLVKEAAQHWSLDNVHYENFTAELAADASEFIVNIQGSGLQINVPADQSMLNALRDNGIDINSGCETGRCGACRVDYQGEVEHKDSILTKSEKKQCMIPCVSRAKGAELTISLP